MSEEAREWFAVCVEPGKFYGGREYPSDIRYDNSDTKTGDWVAFRMVRSKEGVPTPIGCRKTEPALTTIVYEGKVYLDVTVVFSQTSLYSEDMDDYISIPQLADVEEFEYDVTYALLVTWMDPVERNIATQRSGNKLKWKLAMKSSQAASTAGMPTSRMGYSFVSQKHAVQLTGLVVGQDSNDKRRYYVWCPGCPLHFDGIVTEDPKCLLKIGKFIKFLMERREYDDVFTRRESRHFYILCYEDVAKPPCEVFVQTVIGDDRRMKNIIKMASNDYVKCSSALKRASEPGVGNGYIFRHNKLEISDDKGKLNAVPEGHMCNLMLIRQKPTEPWMTQWRVHDVTSIRRPPPQPKRIENGNGAAAAAAVAAAGPASIADGMQRLSVDTIERQSPAQVTRSKSVEMDDRRPTTAESSASYVSSPPPSSHLQQQQHLPLPAAAAPPPAAAAPSTTPSTPTHVLPPSGPFDDLDIDEHIAFVEAYCNRNEAVYLWIIDEPQQAVIWGCKNKKKPPVGTFIRGFFKQQADGRLYVNMDDYDSCKPPTNIKIFDRSGHAIVRTDIQCERTSKGESQWSSKYLGVIEDTQRCMPRNTSDRERYVAQIGKRKQEKDFVWTIEMLLETTKESNTSASSAASSPSTRANSMGRRPVVAMRSPATSTRSNGSVGGGETPIRPVSVTSPPLSTLSSYLPPAAAAACSPADAFPSPGFESRKTSMEDEGAMIQRPMSRASAGGGRRESVNDAENGQDDSRFHVNDEEWNEDTRLARVELDPCIKLVETFANGFTGLFGDQNVVRLFGDFLDPPRFDRIMELTAKHNGGFVRSE